MRGTGWRLAGAVTAVLLTVDALTKGIVQGTMEPGQSMPIFGDVLRLTYVFNPGAAFGLSVGPSSRWILSGLAVLAVVVLIWAIRRTPSEARGRLAAMGLVLGGALGNLVDRIRHQHGVVDFLDLGMGGFRWPVFNVADIGITTGALLLVVLLWEDGEGPHVDPDGS